MLRLSYDIKATRRIRDDLAQLADGFRSRVLGRAIAGLKRRIKPQAARAITAKFNLPSQLTTRRISVASEDLAVDVIGTGTEINLAFYGGRWSKRSEGATYQFYKSGPRLTVKSAFIRGTGSKRRMVRRKERGGKLVPRLPIVGRFGPSVGSNLLNSEPGVTAFAEDFLLKEIDRLIAVEQRDR